MVSSSGTGVKFPPNGTGVKFPPKRFKKLPYFLRVGDALDQAPKTTLPSDVVWSLQEQGMLPTPGPYSKEIDKNSEKTIYCSFTTKQIKVSFHETMKITVSATNANNETTNKHYCIQFLGARLSDKALFDHRKPCCIESQKYAAELASRLGVRVPKLYAAGKTREGRGRLGGKEGKCDEIMEEMDWMLWEWIETDTIEDKVRAPNIGEIIRDECITPLKRLGKAIGNSEFPGPNIDPKFLEECTKFIPYFPTIESYVKYLKEELCPMISLSNEELGFDPLKTIEFIEKKIDETTKGSDTGSTNTITNAITNLALIHQDLHPGNALCSLKKEQNNPNSWSLDALIDWESAAIASSDFFIPRASNGSPCSSRERSRSSRSSKGSNNSSSRSGGSRSNSPNSHGNGSKSRSHSPKRSLPKIDPNPRNDAIRILMRFGLILRNAWLYSMYIDLDVVGKVKKEGSEYENRTIPRCELEELFESTKSWMKTIPLQK